jgi:AraC-like DNA-binding protein
MNSSFEENDYAQKKMPMELFHLFVGQPQCVMVDDLYVSDKHLHKEIEMAYVKTGQVEIMVENRQYTVKAGELLCIRGSVLHQYLPKRQEADIVKIKFMKEWLLPPFFRNSQKEAYQQLYNQVFLTRCDTYIRNIIEEMLACPLNSYQEYYYFGKLVEMTSYLLSNPEAVAQTMAVTMENLRYMESALEYMQENCYGKLTLKMLADHLGLTESYCSKYIKKNAGISFVEYLNAIRINNAQRLLTYTDYNINEIVDKTGFASVQTFNRVFRFQTGQSPSEYRKRKKRRIYA